MSGQKSPNNCDIIGGLLTRAVEQMVRRPGGSKKPPGLADFLRLLEFVGEDSGNRKDQIVAGWIGGDT